MSDTLIQVQKVVVAAFLHDRENILLAKRARSKSIAPGKYHLPGGHVEYGEHPAAALARELREELAVKAVVREPLWVFHYTLGTNHTVGLVFRVPLDVARQDLHWDAADIDECVWVSEEELGNYMSLDDHNYHAALAGFAQLRRINRCP